ncbi:Nup93/Nic96-domain-containing protein [Phlyctochytrium arcticum]|nr:Nup93/Nic96-domain-containing protein [Phlyctochytrium arcticum]
MVQEEPHNLRQLLERSRQLTVHINPSGVPQLERGLDQIETESKRLYKKTTRASDAGAANSNAGPAGLDPRTAILLANKGFDPDRVRQTLDQIDLSQTFEPLHAVSDTDIEGFLNNEYENIVTMAIFESKQATEKTYEDNYERYMHREWEKMRKTVFQEMGQHSTPFGTSGNQSRTTRDLRSSQFPQSSPAALFSKSTRSAPSNFGDTSLRKDSKNFDIHPRMGAYSKVIKDINERRRTGQDAEMILAFHEAARDMPTTEQSQTTLFGCWTIIYQMLVGDPGRARGPNRQPLRFREYANVHFDNGTSAAAVEYRQKLIHGARSWLEDAAYKTLTNFVRNKHASIGGTPSIHNEVKASLELKYHRNGEWDSGLQIVEGQPFWAHVFTLVRCGKLKEAFQHIDKHGAFVQKHCPDFPAYFRAWSTNPTGRLPNDVRNRLLQEWNARIRDHENDNEIDPFKFALYKIIGRCELMNRGIRNIAVTTTEDYMWLQLTLVREEVLDTDAVQERYTLRDIGNKMRTIGPAHFKHPVLWFQMLLLCGEFELAVSDLVKQQAYTYDGLHFAIALASYGALRIPANPNELQDGDMLLTGDRIVLPSKAAYITKSFSIAQLIFSFVDQIAHIDASLALHYALALGILGDPLSRQDTPGGNSTIHRNTIPGGKQYTHYTHRLIRDIVLISGEFELMLGVIRTNGTRTAGEIEKYQSLVHIVSPEELKLYITIPAAEQAEREGRLTDAIKLHHLAGEPGRVVDILNRQLSERLLEHRYRADALTSSTMMNTNTSPDQSPDSFPTTAGDPADLARQVLDFYSAHPHMASRISVDARTTCNLLTTLTKFMTLCDRKQYESALPVLLSTGLVPHTCQMSDIQAKANAFKLLSDSVTKIMSDVLVAASRAIVNLREALTNERIRPGEQGTRDRHIAELRDMGQAMILYAGQLQYRIPGETLSAMNKMLFALG